jgi:glucuronoarabinoxylan endo-1,4-beta-xylanase
MPMEMTAKTARVISLLGLLLVALVGVNGQAQTTTYVVDQFDPAGTGGNSYSGGQIGNVWGNWFGTAFQSLVWDSASDASNNASSGSMKITCNFSSANNQFEVYNGLNGLNPPLLGLQFTNFQCDVRFAAGSATVTNGGVVIFGHLQFGTSTAANGQEYFGGSAYGIDIVATNINWVHISIPINAVASTNLQSLNDVLIHIYGPWYGSGATLNGASTLWVDNIKFVGVGSVTSNCLVDWNDVHQRIDGFGASSAWDSTWTTTQADLLFSPSNGLVYTDNLGHTTTNNGIGLSLLRNRVAPATSPSSNALPTTVETSIMQMAQTRGARVWSSPWTPAAGFKNNGATSGGGYLGSGANATNLAYAHQLASYVASMKNTYGINLYALSIQNEPDAKVTTYDSCNWTAQQIHDFTTNLYNALVASNLTSTKIMLPESQNWQDYSNLAATAMNDANVAADVGIVAVHNYDGNYGPASLAKNSYGKALWETEVSLLSGSDSSIANGVYYAQRIFQFMTQAQVNAWHYWWLIASSTSTGNQGLLDNNAAITKRLFTVGNYSRFVRPNYYRIGVSNNTFTSISAYRATNSTSFAIVAVNTNTSTAISQTFNLTNFTVTGSVTPWITSSNLSLASQSPVVVGGSSFTYTLPAMSVVTFVGQGSTNPPNTAPTLAPIAGQTINAGVTLMVTNVATDTDQPPQTLTFSLLSAPNNATLTPLNNTNAVFTWRPLVSQANTTNPITVKVADGTPGLSATNSYTIKVNPLAQPTVSSISVSGGQVSLVATGAVGPDYTLWASTNLTSWQVLFTSNSPVTPVTLVDTNFNTNPVRFYRIQLGP